MKVISREQFLSVLNLSSGAYDQIQHSTGAALAFGSPIPGTPGRYLDLDLVGMALAAGLADTLGRRAATVVVLGFFNRWAAATGEVDTNSGRHFFGLGLVLDQAGKKLREVRITHGSPEEVFRDLKGAGSIMLIDLRDIVWRIRARARTIGLDLSNPFFYASGHPKHQQILTEFKSERESRVARLRRDKKKRSQQRKLHEHSIRTVEVGAGELHDA